MRFLDTPPRVGLGEFVALLNQEGVDGEGLAALARSLVGYYGSTGEEREAYRAGVAEILELERRWYASLAAGAPDFSIYAAEAYVADTWACWRVYSRGYLRGIERAGLLVGLDDAKAVVDLGCGSGLTTAALTELFPAARVVGTNLLGTLQTRVARRLADRFAFDVEDGPPLGDVVFASEYFEHFEAPVDHLRDVLDATRPRALFVANAFGARSTGHFERYLVDEGPVAPRVASRAFDAELRARGYEKVATPLWNHRPTYWRRAAGR